MTSPADPKDSGEIPVRWNSHPQCTPEEEMVARAAERVRTHHFHPRDDGGLTVDRALGRQGIADLADTDWLVRLMATRDLVRAGDKATARVASGLLDSSVDVRHVSATALGILRVDTAVRTLEHALCKDGDALIRSQAAVALGQIESASSLGLLRDRLANDPSRDVQHQCELAIDQIQKGMGATDELRAAFVGLDPATFKTARAGAQAPDFTLPDTEDNLWHLGDFRGKSWVVLIWIFADWCPVCHREFVELIEMRGEFERGDVKVATLETHDRYRARVMVGKELDPRYWFANESFKDAYTQRIWWPHLLDRAGAVGAVYGVDPMAFCVHAEYINRPSTVIIDPAGLIRFAYYGTFWGDRPSIRETLEMIQSERFDFVHPKRLVPAKADH